MPIRKAQLLVARWARTGAVGLALTGAAMVHAQAQLWASSCMSCHGPGGKAVGTGLAIGGKPAQELYNKLLGYKNGKLPATVMHQHAKGYSDEELSRIADHFASLK